MNLKTWKNISGYIPGNFTLNIISTVFNLNLQMYQAIDSHISRCSPITADELEIFHSSLKPKTFNKRAYLLQQGEVCKFEGYIVKGCVKKYYIDKHGAEVILQFATEDWWISDIGSFSEQKPSNLFIETIEDTELLMIDFESKEKLFREIPHLERVFRLMVQRSYSVLESRFYAAVSHLAEDRYLEFIQKYPDLIHRIPQLEIASFLGITPETLSRVKSKISRLR